MADWLSDWLAHRRNDPRTRGLDEWLDDPDRSSRYQPQPPTYSEGSAWPQFARPPMHQAMACKPDPLRLPSDERPQPGPTTPYSVEANGLRYTVLLSEADAIERGLLPAPAVTPAPLVHDDERDDDELDDYDDPAPQPPPRRRRPTRRVGDPAR